MESTQKKMIVIKEACNSLKIHQDIPVDELTNYLRVRKMVTMKFLDTLKVMDRSQKLDMISEALLSKGDRGFATLRIWMVRNTPSALNGQFIKEEVSNVRRKLFHADDPIPVEETIVDPWGDITDKDVLNASMETHHPRN